jgi:hypothetical protein
MSGDRDVAWIAMAVVCAMMLTMAAGCLAEEDRVSYLDNGAIRLGIDLDLGGAITYLAKDGADNMINSADWGRQIQLSFYSGPVPFAPDGKQPSKTWAGLGWNPIQSGDCFGNRSKVLETTNDGKTLYVKSIPMQWPLNDVPGECTFECWITLRTTTSSEGNVAHVRARLTNNRSDHIQYPGRGQELPAIYTNGPWYNLVTYEGDKPYSGGELTVIPPQFPWAGWRATENWAALVNDEKQGLGIWEPGTYQFIGGFAGKPGKGGPKDGPTGYIAPTGNDILDWNIVYDFSYTLIVGSVDEIRDYVYKHAAPPQPPVWRFEKDRQHWVYGNCTDTGWPIKGELKVLVEGNDPQMHAPASFWLAKDAPKLYIEAAYHTTDTHAQVFWTRSDAPGVDEAKSVHLDVVADGQYHMYEVDLASMPTYNGVITGLRFDPVTSGKPGEYVRVRSIGLRPPEPPQPPQLK